MSRFFPRFGSTRLLRLRYSSYPHAYIFWEKKIYFQYFLMLFITVSSIRYCIQAFWFRKFFQNLKMLAWNCSKRSNNQMEPYLSKWAFIVKVCWNYCYSNLPQHLPLAKKLINSLYSLVSKKPLWFQEFFNWSTVPKGGNDKDIHNDAEKYWKYHFISIYFLMLIIDIDIDIWSIKQYLTVP